MTHPVDGIAYELDGGHTWPSPLELAAAIDLPGRLGTIDYVEQPESSVEATFFDTASFDLLRAGIELRRQTGDDPGWYLYAELPGGTAHTERVALGRSERLVPIRLRRLVETRTSGAALSPIAGAQWQTRTAQLRAAGDLLATIRVELGEVGPIAPPAGEADVAQDTGTTWQVAQVDPAQGSPTVVGKRAVRTLQQLGGAPPSPQAPLQRCFAGAMTNAAAGPRREHVKDGKDGKAKPVSAGDILGVYLALEVDRVIDHDLPARLDAPEAIHQMRVAVRRVRTALHTFGPLFDQERVTALEPELSWLSSELGSARDAEVLRSHVLAGVGADLLAAPAARVIAEVERETRRHQRAAFAQLLTVLDSERYRHLIHQLRELVRTPAWADRAERPARKVLLPLILAQYTQLMEKLRRAVAAPEGADRDELLHVARKAAKRTRYATDAVAGLHGRDAEAFARAAERLQEALGAHQDTVVIQGQLRDLAAQASPAAAFSYGRLHAMHDARRQEIDEAIWRASTAMHKKSLRSWLM